MSFVRRFPGAIPAVEVLVSALPAGAVRVTLYRHADGITMPVRGAVNAATAGQLTRVDYEAPLGVPVTYWAEAFNATGVSIGATPQQVITLDDSSAWLHNPLDPRGAVKVGLRPSTGRAINRPLSGSVIDSNTRVGVITTGGRSGIRDLDLDVIVNGGGDADRVQTMLGRGAEPLPPILCLRVESGSRRRLPRPFFIAPDWVENDLTHFYGGDAIAFEGAVHEAEPPALGLFTPLLTLGDLKRAYSTLGAIQTDAQNQTLGHVNRRYDLAEGA